MILLHLLKEDLVDTNTNGIKRQAAMLLYNFDVHALTTGTTRLRFSLFRKMLGPLREVALLVQTLASLAVAAVVSVQS